MLNSQSWLTATFKRVYGLATMMAAITAASGIVEVLLRDRYG